MIAYMYVTCAGGVHLREVEKYKCTIGGRVWQSCLLIHVKFLLTNKICNYSKIVPQKSHMEVTGRL